jgi:hypothetical protein
LPQMTPQPQKRSAPRVFGWIASAFIIGTAAVVAQSNLYGLMTHVVLVTLVTCLTAVHLVSSSFFGLSGFICEGL